MPKNLQFVLLIFLLCASSIFAAPKASVEKKEPPKKVVPQLSVPYERPIGFTLNLGGIPSMTFEGRFLLGLVPNISLVVSPSYQNTLELPLYHPERQNWTLMSIRRFNAGIGVRGHFYEYDSWDGLFIEGMGRAGLTWFGEDPSVWSITPSLIFGYAAVYKSGYTVSFGLGVEWEFLIGEDKGPNYEFFKSAYYGLTKLPLTGELSIGWTF